MRSGTDVYLFENGVQVGATQTFSGSIASVANQLRVGGASTGQYDLNGYVSNVRMVIGSVVYSTSGFTTPTSSLTAIANTSLLTCQSNRFVDNSSNAITITPVGNTSVQPFSPFAPSAAYSTSVNGASGYFDGSGDYLDLTPGTIGTGDFTLECWVYFNSLSANQGILDTRDNSNTNGFALVGRSTGQVSMADGTSLIGTAASATAGQWIHVAASRASGVLSFYVNGTRSGGTVSNTSNFSNNRLRVGAIGSAGENLGGYVASARLLTTAIYSGTTITVPTSPLTAISGTSSLLNFTNAGIFDNTGKNNLETVADAQIDTSVKKYGTGSMEFDGTGDWLVSPSNSLYDLNGDFTIEFWIYLNSLSGNPTPIDRAYTGSALDSNGYLIQYGSSALKFYGGGSSITSSQTDSTSTWFHYAIVRSGSTITMYRNGTSVGSATISTAFTYARELSIGGNSRAGGGFAAGQGAMNGYIDDLRITKGVARYTTAFTPPTAAFPNL